uniref:Histidine triad protein n=1 Tax=Tetraselmis sp. GSL018 TaxID=582737 RepID=A0A061SI96_9CHLO
MNTALTLGIGTAFGWLFARLASKRRNGCQPDPKFELWPKLANGKHEVCSLGLCKVLLMDDTNYPCWVVLVPEKNNLVEVSDLAPTEQAVVWKEVQHCANVLQRLFPCDKMNIAAIGNICPQLHIHITCRKKDDVAWPGPCYGAAPAKPYSPSELEAMLKKLRSALA